MLSSVSALPLWPTKRARRGKVHPHPARTERGVRQAVDQPSPTVARAVRSDGPPVRATITPARVDLETAGEIARPTGLVGLSARRPRDIAGRIPAVRWPPRRPAGAPAAPAARRRDGTPAGSAFGRRCRAIDAVPA